MVYGILYFICFCILFSFSFYLNLKLQRVLFKQFYVYAKKKILFKNAFKSLILMVLDHKQKQIFRRKQKTKTMYKLNPYSYILDIYTINNTSMYIYISNTNTFSKQYFNKNNTHVNCLKMHIVQELKKRNVYEIVLSPFHGLNFKLNTWGPS